MDRYYNRYWWFYRDGRIFVESPESKEWGYYSSKGEVLDTYAICAFSTNKSFLIFSWHA